MLLFNWEKILYIYSFKQRLFIKYSNQRRALKNENALKKIYEELIINAQEAQEIEIDGNFKVDNFNYNMFDPNEVAIQHTNVPEEDQKSCKHIAAEVKN